MSLKKLHTNQLLLREFKKGNQKAFRKLFDLFWGPMFLNARSIVSNADIAKDIVQNIWVDLWQKREHLEIRNFEPYIFRAVNNGCFKHLRDNKFDTIQLEVITSLHLTSKSNVENQHDLEETQIVIEKSLNQMTPRCQQVFRLSRMEEVSNEEISLRLGISKRSVENQISLALKSIKHNLSNGQTSLTLLFMLFL
jgi:RNA polymerase sigma-70 factor (family 1)